MARQVNIPDELYEKIEKSLDEFGFKTVDEYVEFVLREVLESDSSQEEQVFSKEEEEMIKKRLRDLGYLD
ncbi:MAG: CopG family transcriptional regulator [Thermotogae bacterium]|nr:CopG family transcriptional regulator [Thermotogota bacterium]